MSEQPPPPMKCSFMDLDAGGIPCGNPARWACRIDAGPWMLGWWGCDEHKPYLETLLPVLTTPQGSKVVRVGAILTRSPLILHLDYLATGQQGVPMNFRCDICDRPIVRDYERNKWVHVEATDDSHQARVG